MFSCRVFMTAVLAVLFCASLALAGEPELVHVHFIVTSTEAAQGQDIDQVMDEFKTELLTLAGGYTELGQTTGGYLAPGGEVVKSPGVSFLVAAPRDLSAEIKAWGDEHFSTPVYVLEWEAEQVF